MRCIVLLTARLRLGFGKERGRVFKVARVVVVEEKQVSTPIRQYL